jgi:GntR family transcriptional repressor for pyruvate dehydrogenase complex
MGKTDSGRRSMALDKIKVPSVREAFVQEIENKILSGELKVGDRLPPARELCRLMGVSLTVVNAGVSELASIGFLEVQPRRGTFVADYKLNGRTDAFAAVMRYNGGKLDDHEIRSCCESRIALDSYVAKLAIERAGDQQIAQLGEYAKKLRGITDVDEFCTAITDFYRKLYSMSDNTFLTLLYNSTVEPQKGIYAAYFLKNGFDSTVANTETIYECIAARDADKAGRYLLEAVNSAISGETSILRE